MSCPVEVRNFFGKEATSGIIFSPPSMCVVVSVPIWMVCITIPIDCRSLPDIGKLGFDSILLIQMNIGVLLHSVTREFLLIFGICFYYHYDCQHLCR